MKAFVRVHEPQIRDYVITLEGESKEHLERQIAFIRETGQFDGAEEKADAPNIVNYGDPIDQWTEGDIQVEEVHFEETRLRLLPNADATDR